MKNNNKINNNKINNNKIKKGVKMIEYSESDILKSVDIMEDEVQLVLMDIVKFNNKIYIIDLIRDDWFIIMGEW